MKLQDLANKINGEVLGNPDIDISGFSSLTSAKSGDISFVLDPSYVKTSIGTQASACVTFKRIEHLQNQIIVKDARKAFADILVMFHPTQHPFSTTSPTALISDSATVAPTAYIHHYSVVEDHVTIDDGTYVYNHVSIGSHTKIGKNCIIYPHVTIYDHIEIGDNVIIHAGTVVGSDGFGFHFHNGSFIKIPQTGRVVIKDNVEIQSNTVIDRGTIDDTVIGKGSKLDNLVHIAHNTTIGHDTVIAAQVGCTGRTNIGSYVSIGGQVGIDAGSIEDKVMIAGKSAVTKTIKAGSVVSGNPAIDHRKALKKEAFIRKLCEKEGIL